MDLPAGYDLRAPQPDELEAVAEVLAADQLADTGHVVLDADFLREAWRRGAAFDLSRDAWVAVDSAGVIVGYGQIKVEESGLAESWGVVHPKHRGRGIGAVLLDTIEARSTELLAGSPAPRFRHMIWATDQAAEAMLRLRAMRPVHHFWHMQVDLPDGFETGPAPAGVEIAEIEPAADLPAVHAIITAAFAEDRSHHPDPLDQWVEEHTGSPSYDPSLWLLARDGSTPVGALTGSVLGGNGWVDYLATLSVHRGRGVGAALLRRSFATFAGRGIRRVILNVDAENPTGATALYEREGMRAITRWDVWERAAP
jgi:mycothiol synthase